MRLPRLLAPVLRALQCLDAVLLLGISTHLLRQSWGAAGATLLPSGRLLYAALLSGVSATLSLAWMLCGGGSVPGVHHVADLLCAAAWFTAFGLLVDWYGDVLGCSKGWAWDGGRWEGVCGEWDAGMAFAVVAALLWFASFLLGVLGARPRAPSGGVEAAVSTAPTG